MSSVNRHLRSVTLDIPALWSTIDIMQSELRTTLNLERSDPLLLEVNMSISPEPRIWAGSGHKLLEFIRLITPHENRIRSIQAIFHSSPLANIAFERFLSRNNLYNLRRLDFGVSTLSFKAGAVFKPPMPSVLWRIEDLRLHRLKVERINGLFPLWTIRLGLIGIVGLPWETFRNILSRTNSLQYLELSECDMNDPADEDAQQILLSELKEISMIGCDPSLISNVLGIVTAPKLASLRIEFSTSVILSQDDVELELEDWVPEEIAWFPTLQSLHLTGCSMSPQHWTQLFHSVSSLENLHLGACDLRGPELHALGGDGGADTVACPNLVNLELSNEIYLNSATLAGIILARLALVGSGVKKIESVALGGMDEMNVDPEDIQVIRGVVDYFTLGVMGVAQILLESDDDYDEEDSDSDASSVGSFGEGDIWLVENGASNIVDSRLRSGFSY